MALRDRVPDTPSIPPFPFDGCSMLSAAVARDWNSPQALAFPRKDVSDRIQHRCFPRKLVGNQARPSHQEPAYFWQNIYIFIYVNKYILIFHYFYILFFIYFLYFLFQDKLVPSGSRDSSLVAQISEFFVSFFRGGFFLHPMSVNQVIRKRACPSRASQASGLGARNHRLFEMFPNLGI